MSTLQLDQLRRYTWALGLNTLIWVAQFFVVFVLADSLALLGDAAHSVADTLVLLGTCIVIRLTIAHPASDHTQKKRILTRGAVALLWLSAVYLTLEGFERIMSPVYFPGWPVVIMAFVAAVGNFFAHRVIHGVDKSLHDHVHKANALHILSDFFISVAVVLSGLGTLFLNFPALDGWIALLVAQWMTWRGWEVFQETRGHKHHDHEHGHHH